MFSAKDGNGVSGHALSGLVMRVFSTGKHQQLSK
jgi:hypothetical protein